jgi:ubiquinone biosynthesis protein UbiJ
MDSLALALRGSFRPEKARGPARLYEVRADSKPLRVLVTSRRVVAPAVTTDDPDVVIDTAPAVISELLTGALRLDDAIEDGRVRLEGDRADAFRFVEMFRFPSPEEAKV